MIVEFVIPTYNRFDNLRSTLSSLLCQTNPNWLARVVIDGIESGEKVKDLCDDLNDTRIRLLTLGARANDWGHTPRELGKQYASGDYVIMTGDDNYYVPVFVEELSKVVSDKPGMVYWDMVHSHYNYEAFVCTPAFNHIDIGAFATRNDLAKQIKLNTSYAADGEFVEEFKVKFPGEKIVKIKKILYVHN